MNEVITEIGSVKFWLLTVVLGLVLGITANFITDALRSKFRSISTNIHSSNYEKNTRDDSAIDMDSGPLAWIPYVVLAACGVALLFIFGGSHNYRLQIASLFAAVALFGATADGVHSAIKSGISAYVAWDNFWAAIFASALGFGLAYWLVST